MSLLSGSNNSQLTQLQQKHKTTNKQTSRQASKQANNLRHNVHKSEVEDTTQQGSLHLLKLRPANMKLLLNAKVTLKATFKPTKQENTTKMVHTHSPQITNTGFQGSFEALAPKVRFKSSRMQTLQGPFRAGVFVQGYSQESFLSSAAVRLARIHRRTTKKLSLLGNRGTKTAVVRNRIEQHRKPKATSRTEAYHRTVDLERYHESVERYHDPPWQ